MSDEFSMTIAIPADDDGYVLLQSPNCGTYFKATPSDVQDDGVLELFCPSCGLAGKSYITEDVFELAIAMTKNKSMEIASFPCCQRIAKIKPMLKMTGCYCPFCGVKNYEVE